MSASTDKRRPIEYVFEGMTFDESIHPQLMKLIVKLFRRKAKGTWNSQCVESSFHQRIPVLVTTIVLVSWRIHRQCYFREPNRPVCDCVWLQFIIRWIVIINRWMFVFFLLKFVRLINAAILKLNTFCVANSLHNPSWPVYIELKIDKFIVIP